LFKIFVTFVLCVENKILKIGLKILVRIAIH
jgi:hypothetical protein